MCQLKLSLCRDAPAALGEVAWYDWPMPLASPLESAQRETVRTPELGAIEVYAAGPEGARPLLLVHSVNAAASAYEVRPLFEHARLTRPTYAFDLPGFGLSERSARSYRPRLMTDAVLEIARRITERHRGPTDAVGVSLGCEFVARAASERAELFRALAFVSPTGVEGREHREAPLTDRGSRFAERVLTSRLLSNALFDNLTRPSVIRYFLERTFGSKRIDEGLFAYCVATAREEGAKHAPLQFVSGRLFSADITDVYAKVRAPVVVIHGRRGDFTRYDGLRAFPAWRVVALDTGALPYFEDLSAVIGALSPLESGGYSGSGSESEMP